MKTGRLWTGVVVMVLVLFPLFHMCCFMKHLCQIVRWALESTPWFVSTVLPQPALGLPSLPQEKKLDTRNPWDGPYVNEREAWAGRSAAIPGRPPIPGPGSSGLLLLWGPQPGSLVPESGLAKCGQQTGVDAGTVASLGQSKVEFGISV